jgi:4-hydroxy-tetrahydrodipicolinate synthase
MPSAYRPTGLLVPVITPFAADGRVDIDTLERLAAELLEAGATGLVACSRRRGPDPDARRAVAAGRRDPAALQRAQAAYAATRS